MTETQEKSAIEPIDITVRAVLTHKSPLVMHHPRTADPEDELKQAIDEIVQKDRGRQKLTAEDRKRKDALQWRACLYTEDVPADGGEVRETLAIPAMWLFRALEQGGRAQSKGTAVVRSVTIMDPWFLLNYDGPEDIQDLARDPRFRWRTCVNPDPAGRKKKLLPSVRAIFPVWSLTANIHLVTDMGLGWKEFEHAFRAAGNIGIGDARNLGYGRFSVRLTKMGPR